MAAAFRTFLFLIVCFNLWANGAPSPWYKQDVDKSVSMNVELFLSSTCKHCEHLDTFFQNIAPDYPWLHIKRYVINQDKKALTRFNQLITTADPGNFSVPSVFFCNSRWVGFSSAEETGQDLLRGINFCKDEIEKNGKLTPTTTNVLKRWAHGTRFDSAIIDNPSPVQYIFTIALMDAFNPCALFCMAGFFALLLLQNDRKKQVQTGLLFIAVIGGVHYLQQVYMITFFKLLPWFHIPAACSGLFIIYFSVKYYQKKKQDNLFFLLSFFLALFLQAYQQSCVSNWSYAFGQWISHQQLTNGQYIAYQLVYYSTYLLSLVFIFILYVYCMRLERFARFEQKLNTFGLLYILTIGLILIIYPAILSHLGWSLWLVVLLLMISWGLNKYKNRVVY